MKDFEQNIINADDAKREANKLTIPKHRFDCVNLCLKETKQALREKTLEADAAQIRIAELKKMLFDAKVELALSQHRAKNLTAAKALVNISDLRLEQDGTVPGLDEQVHNIKKSQSYLFDIGESAAYILVPVAVDDSFNKTITNYVKKHRSTKR